MTFLRNVRIVRMHGGFMFAVGSWGCRYSFDRLGRFSNGSRWSSGWHNWTKDAEL